MPFLFLPLLICIMSTCGYAHAKYHQFPQDCWYCPPCHKKFYDQGSLDKHMRKKHGVTKDPVMIKKYTETIYACRECRYGFPTRRKLAEHNRKVHPQRPRNW